jgi:hypothetical protein
LTIIYVIKLIDYLSLLKSEPINQRYSPITSYFVAIRIISSKFVNQVIAILHLCFKAINQHVFNKMVIFKVTNYLNGDSRIKKEAEFGLFD